MLRVLSHKIRTPLSVISNDLNYFKNLIDPNECERGILKCRQISEVFKPALCLSSSDSEHEKFNLNLALQEIFGEIVKKNQSELVLIGSKNNFLQLLRWLKELFVIKRIEVLDPDIFKQVAKVRFEFLESLIMNSERGDLSSPCFALNSLTDIYSIASSDESILPMLADIVLLSFYAECQMLNDVELEISFMLEV